MTAPRPRTLLAVGTVALGIGALALLFAEKRHPLRRPTQAEPGRTLRNVALGAMSLAVVRLVEAPLTRPLAREVERRRWGLVQRLLVPAWARDAVAIVMMDYTVYLWHVATHKIAWLWRFHLVHHLDLDLDSSTALRFHAADMAISAPYRAAQVALIGVSPRALRYWQTWFFASVVFHHSNLRLPAALEGRLTRVLTTPRMHGIHHSAVRSETDSNWSSGLSWWDHLHGTFRLDVAQDEIAIGVPGYRDPRVLGIAPALAMPFRRHRDAWAPPPGSTGALVRLAPSKEIGP